MKNMIRHRIMPKIVAMWEVDSMGGPVAFRFEEQDASFKEMAVFAAYVMARVAASQKARDYYWGGYNLDEIMEKLVKLAKFVVRKEQEKNGGKEDAD